MVGRDSADAVLDGPDRKRRRCNESVARRLPTLNERVQAKYQGADGGVNWFDGVVTRVREDGTCDLRYDDGDEEEGVEARFIRTNERFTKAIASEAKTAIEERNEPVVMSAADVATEAAEVASSADEEQRADAADERENSIETTEQRAGASMELQAADAPVELHCLGELIGTYATLEEAAVAYRHELEAADGYRELSMTWNRLKLHPSIACDTGFRGVQRSHKCKNYVAIHAKTYLGSFVTVDAAAKAYARHVASVNPRPDTDLVLRPGLELYRSTRSETGFTGVFKMRSGRFQARLGEVNLGTFATVEAAAIAYALRRPPLDEDEPVAEGLELITSTTSSTGFKGVTKLDLKYVAKYDRILLGRFRTAKAAAAAYARYVQDPAYRKRSRWDGHQRRT